MAQPTNPNDNNAGKRSTQANQDVINARNPPEQSESSFIGDTFNSGIETGKRLVDEVFSAAGFASRNRSQNLAKAATEEAKSPATAEFSTASAQADWRVKLSIPQQFSTDRMLSPLVRAGGAFTFPYTPTIIVGHSANYNTLQPVHTNYPFHIYENSSVQEIVITGDFTVENAEEGRYWVAAMHYLRSATKMFYGDGDNSGAPPPIVYLNGYGDYVFNNVPCVITNFTIDLPSDVDYIAVPLTGLVEEQRRGGPGGGSDPGNDGKSTTWVPTQSLMTVTVQPTYSRKTISKFNLNKFVNGDFISRGSGFI